MTDDAVEVRPGDPLYVPAEDVATAMSLGACMVEGDSRLKVPSPLPDGVRLEDFARWTGNTAKIRWLSELVDSIFDGRVDFFDIAGAALPEEVEKGAEEVVRLYVPKAHMDKVRLFPGVTWSRDIGSYVATRRAKLSLIYDYLTPAMKAIWSAERNAEQAVSVLVKSRAILQQKEIDDSREEPIREIDAQKKKSA